jgi:hypothetical protein
MAFAVNSAARLLLFPSRGPLTTRQASRDAADRSVAPPDGAFDAGLRRRAFPPGAASLLPGLLAATRTGLAPAGDDELVMDQVTSRHHLHRWAHEGSGLGYRLSMGWRAARARLAFGRGGGMPAGTSPGRQESLRGPRTFPRRGAPRCEGPPPRGRRPEVRGTGRAGRDRGRPHRDGRLLDCRPRGGAGSRPLRRDHSPDSARVPPGIGCLAGGRRRTRAPAPFREPSSLAVDIVLAW